MDENFGVNKESETVQIQDTENIPQKAEPTRVAIICFGVALALWGIGQSIFLYSPELLSAWGWFGVLLATSLGVFAIAVRATCLHPRLSIFMQLLGIFFISVTLGQGAYTGLPYAEYKWILPALTALPAVYLALKRDLQFLAFFGYLCAFAIPVVFGLFSDSPRLVFGYYLIVCSFLPVITFLREWRVLNVSALAWLVALGSFFLYTVYTPALWFSSQLYFLGFFFLYALILIIRQRKAGFNLRNFYDFMLGCGIAVAAILCQLRIVAWSKSLTIVTLVIFSIIFSLLSFYGVRAGEKKNGPLARFYLALVFVLFNLCLHFILPPAVALVFICAEAVFLFRFSSKRGFWRCKAGVYLLLALVPVYYFATQQLAHSGTFAVAIMYLGCAFLQDRERKKQGRRSGRRAWSSWQELVLIVSGFVWWFGGLAALVFNYLPEPGLVFFAVCSAWSFFFYALGKIIRFRSLRGVIFLPLLVSVPAVVLPFFYQTYLEWPAVNHSLSYNYFAGLGGLAWVAYFVCVWTALYRNWGGLISNRRHAQFLVLVTVELIVVLTSSMRAFALETGVSPASLSVLSMLPSLICIMALSHNIKHRPLYGPYRKAMFVVLPFMLFIALAAWFVFNLASPGSSAPGGVYVPLFNPVELGQLLCIFAFGYWQRRLRKSLIPTAYLPDGKLFWVYGSASFLWLHGMMFRVVQFFSGAQATEVLHFNELQFIFASIWVIFGVMLWISSTKFASAFSWITGVLLLLAGCSGLVMSSMQIKERGLTAFLLLASAGLIFLLIWFSPAPFSQRSKKSRA